MSVVIIFMIVVFCTGCFMFMFGKLFTIIDESEDAQIKRCTEQTVGRVIGVQSHFELITNSTDDGTTFNTHERFFSPVIEFTVNSVAYKADYCGFSSTRKDDVHTDEEFIVHYNPDNPKDNYTGYRCADKYTTKILCKLGFIFMIVGVVSIVYTIFEYMVGRLSSSARF
ncbi:MAG: DUF3592 domain-containing protein [Roseburia sp.]|nr:DUF3592 domain-containing protein [Roseburia sp.]